jgi:predicted dehydrogenase
MKRLRVGVVGCGLVAQVMHLPYLRELDDRYEVRAVCDLSARALRRAGDLFPEARAHARWEDALAEELDAVLVLTPGSHAPVALAAAESGRHVFVEKPMCLNPSEGREMIDAAAAAGVVLMVGYMKRYDPAYEELARVLDRDAVRLARITTSTTTRSRSPPATSTRRSWPSSPPTTPAGSPRRSPTRTS